MRRVAPSITAALVGVCVIGAAVACGGSTKATDRPPARGVVTIATVKVGHPGNPSVGIVPFQGPPKQSIFKDCTDAPAGCLLVGAVDYAYRIGELEITVGQYVTFLNTVDPDGTNTRNLYGKTMSPSAWPKYGPINRSQGGGVSPGTHYSVAYPEWTNKPIGFMTFPRAARFVNSLTNGDILSRVKTSPGGFEVLTYRVRLSRETEQGMYDLRTERQTGAGATRGRSTGFVIPSQDEWIKAAYYDPSGRGKFSYWLYPTSPVKRPNASSLDAANGNVTNADEQPLSTYNPKGINAPASTYPTWCPQQAEQSACESVNPLGLSSSAYQSIYQGNLSTVGQTRTRSPWGTLDQGGNAVEWTDTITSSPTGYQERVWRRMHGGIANARAYQLWISAVGLLAQDDPFFERTYPWVGLRVGVIGDLG